jgi:hypothetical protein
VKVFQNKWNTAKWHCRIGWKIASDFSCLVEPGESERIDCRIKLLGSFYRGIKKFDWGYLSRSDKLGLVNGINPLCVLCKR